MDLNNWLNQSRLFSFHGFSVLKVVGEHGLISHGNLNRTPTYISCYALPPNSSHNRIVINYHCFVLNSVMRIFKKSVVADTYLCCFCFLRPQLHQNAIPCNELFRYGATSL